MKTNLLEKLSHTKKVIMDDLKDPNKRIRRKNMVTKILLAIFRTLLLTGLGFIIVFPIIQQVLWGFHHPSQTNNPTVIYIPEVWSTLNFKVAITAMEYKSALWNTFRISLISMVLQIVSTALAGYVFARLKFKGSNIVFLLVVLTIVIPPNAIMMSRSRYFSGLKLSGNEFSLYLLSFLGMGIRSGIFIYIFKSFFEGLPKELEESAMIDGASVFRTFWNIMLPNAKGAIITVGLFAFVWQWNDSYYANMLNIGGGGSGGTTYLLSTQLLNFTENIQNYLLRNNFVQLLGGNYAQNNDYKAVVLNVAALLTMLPLLIMYIFVQKQFVESIERTGIVG